MQKIIDIIEDIPGAEFAKPSPKGQVWRFDDRQAAINFAFEHRETVTPYNWVWKFNELPDALPTEENIEVSADVEQLTILIKR